MNKRLFWILLLTTMGPVAVQAATVYMKDGSQVRGTVVSATARDIQLSGPQGLRTLSTDQISRIDYSESSSPSPESVPPSAPTPPRAETLPPSPRVWRPFSNEGAAVWPRNTQQLLSLGIGVGIPLSRVDFQSAGGGRSTNGAAGIQFTPQYLMKLNSRWATGLELNYLNRSERLTRSLLPSSETQVSGSHLVLMPILKYSLTDRGVARPYISGGVGAQYSSTLIDAQPSVGFVWSDTSTDEPRTLVDDAHWGLATSARLGVDFSMVGPGVFGVEFGWTHVENDAFSPTPAGIDLGVSPVSGIQNNLAVTFRYGWRF